MSGLRRHPSQASMWYTTVPHSLRTHTLGSRHVPTRRSLRHSRIVVSKTLPKSQGDRRRWCRERIVLCSMKVAVGLVTLTLSLVLLIWDAKGDQNELVCLSGALEITSGVVGILWDEWLKSFTINYIGASERLYGCVLVSTVVVPTLATVSCLAAFVFLATKLYLLYVWIPFCKPEKDNGCLCGDAGYRGLSCEDVKSLLPVALTAGSALSLVGLALCLWYLARVIHKRLANWREGYASAVLSSSS